MSHALNRTIHWLTVATLLTAVTIATFPEIHRIAIKFANLLYLLKHPVVA